MKVRQGFVSNSSSSSFVVMGNTQETIRMRPVVDTLIVPEDFGGCLEFGWGPARFRDLGSKINWAYIQASHMRNTIGIAILEEALMKEFNVKYIEWLISTTDTNGSYGYIDHQSIGNSLEIFDSVESMRQFLFCDSYINVDNDNH